MTRIQPNRRYAKTINISTKQFLPSLTGTQYFLTDSLFGSNTIKNYKRLKNINFYLFLKFHTIKYAHDVLFYIQNRQKSFFISNAEFVR